MKKLLLFSGSLLIGTAAYAQPWLDANSGLQTQNLANIVKAYEEKNAANSVIAAKAEETADGEVKEGKSYHFDRWKWYWEQHTDVDGNLVSPLKNWAEHKAYVKSNKAAAKTTFSDQSNWSFQGPDRSPGGGDGLGRINIVAFHPADTNIFWIGSAGGGAWKTADGGLTWSNINDFLPVLGVSDIDFNPQNPQTIYMCTGDRDASDNFSVGVLKSYDGGASWDTTGLKWKASDMRLANSLEINPIDTNSLTLATSAGIYKSYDGGTTWTQVSGGGFKQIVANPIDTNVLYAAGFSSGTNQVHRSADGGATWQITSSFPANNRIAIATTPADPSIVKVVVANPSNGLDGIYNSSDTGKTFTEIFDEGCTVNLLANSPSGAACGGQGWYDLTIAIGNQNPDEVVVGGVNTWYSFDGGTNWQIVNQWTWALPGITTVHADKHWHAYHPYTTSQTLFECNDGGIYKTTRPTTAWSDLTNGLGITQFYRIAVSDNAPFVVGGAQDNGSKKIQPPAYNELTGGDGMDCQIDYSNSNIFYTSIQYGELRRTLNGGAVFSNIHNNIPGQPQGEWITPFVLHPDDPSTILAGYRNLYVSQNRGNSWTELSPPQSANIKRIAISKKNPEYIYILVGNRTLRYTTDYGATWQFITITFSGNISDIQVDPKDETHLWATTSGYGTSKVADYYIGKGWTVRNANLPDVPVNCLTVDQEDGTVYAGTDIGVFYMDYNISYWQTFSKSLPTVEVTDLGINYATKELWAATYGRGMWKSPKHNANIASYVGNIPLAKDVLTIYPNPSNGRFEIATANKALVGQQVMMRIVGVNGSVALQQSVFINASGNVTINADLPKGSYIVEINKNNTVFAKEQIVIF